MYIYIYVQLLVQQPGLSQRWLRSIPQISWRITYPSRRGSAWRNPCISRARCDLGAGEAAIPVEACELRAPSGDVAESSGWRTFSPQLVLTTLNILWCGLEMMCLGGHQHSKSTFLGNMLEYEIISPTWFTNSRDFFLKNYVATKGFDSGVSPRYHRAPSTIR